MVPPMASEMIEKEVNVMCSPNLYPMNVIPVAQINDAIKKIKYVSFFGVLARPATTGINAFIEGVSLPKKIHHIPL